MHAETYSYTHTYVHTYIHAYVHSYITYLYAVFVDAESESSGDGKLARDEPVMGQNRLLRHVCTACTLRWRFKNCIFLMFQQWCKGDLRLSEPQTSKHAPSSSGKSSTTSTRNDDDNKNDSSLSTTIQQKQQRRMIIRA